MRRLSLGLILATAAALVLASVPTTGHHVARVDNRIVEPYGVPVILHVPIAAGYEPVPTPQHCLAGAPLPEAVAFYSESFEGAHGYTFVSTPLAVTTNLWKVTNFAGAGGELGHNGANRLYFGKTTTGNYAGSGHVAGVAQSPPITLPAVGAATLSFATKWMVEWLKGYDHLWVEALGADGRVHLLCTANAVDRADPTGLGGNSIIGSCSPILFAPCAPGKTAVTPAWETRLIELPPTWAGQTIRLRFTFDSADGLANDYPGWMVDDVQLAVKLPV